MLRLAVRHSWQRYKDKEKDILMKIHLNVFKRKLQVQVGHPR